jgi:CheY-like chemotaxis protein
LNERLQVHVTPRFAGHGPDLVIADVVMPALSGIDLAIIVRETCPACTVLLFSGQIATHELLEGAKVLGHDFDVIPKPVNPLEMLVWQEFDQDSYSQRVLKDRQLACNSPRAINGANLVMAHLMRPQQGSG